MGNKWKGTFEVSIDGEEYTLRPTFDAMETFVQQTGVSEREAFDLIEAGKYNSGMIVSAIHAGIIGEH